MTDKREPGARRRARRTAVAGLAAVAMSFTGLSALVPTAASAKELLAEPFTGQSTPAGVWQYVSPKGAHLPCLTAATAETEGSLPVCKSVKEGKRQADPAGKGSFEITDNSPQDAGGLILNQALSAKAGLHIEFDQFQYNTSTAKGADGLSFFLIDGKTQNPDIGDPGGSLGYNKMDNSIIGVGFDQYGNFSNPKAGWPAGDTGPGVKPNSVVVRGAEAAKYQYVEGVVAPAPLALDKSKKRDEARRKVVVDISTAGFMQVGIDFQDGKGVQTMLKELNLNAIKGQPPLPDSVKLGFAASTGNSTNYHEIQNFKISTLDPDLSVQTTAGEGGKFTATVGNGAAAGPTDGKVTVDIPVPPGMKASSAAGDGWTCTPAEAKVTCTRPGTGADVLKPGATYPPIDVNLASTGAKPVTAPVSATVGTPSDGKTDNNTSAPVEVTTPAGAAVGPDLSMAVTAGDGQVSATVSNAAKAGPTTGEVTAEIALPKGSKVASASGKGWTCTPAEAKVVCKRPGAGDDALQPGAAYPPITVIGASDGDTVTGPVTGSTGTAGETDPSNNTAAPVDVTIKGKPPVKQPNLNVAIDGTGNFVPGGAGTLTATVSNAAGAGPTAKEVSVTIPIPPGMKAGQPTGQGWKCTAAATAVTCTRPGTGGDALQPGASYPPVSVPVTAGQDLKVPVSATATVTTAGDADESDNTAKPVQLPKPGVQIGMTITPNPYKAGEKLTYEIKVTNTGTKPATDVKVASAVAQVWKDVPWKCTASEGSTCPPQAGKGNVDAAVTVAPGGTVTFTADCAVPKTVTVPLKGSATATAKGDVNCDKGCTVETAATAAAAARRQ